MNKFRRMEKEIREYHKMWLAEHIAKMIEIKYRIYNKDVLESYQHFYNSSEDSFMYNKEEEIEIYNYVDDILTNKYGLLIANKAFSEKNICLVDLRKED